MTDNERENKVNEIAQDAFNEAGQAVKNTMLRCHHEAQSKNGADAVRTAMYGVVGALVPATLLLAKRVDLPAGLSIPKTAAEVTPAHGELIYGSLKPEMMTFAGLLAAQMLEKMSYEVTTIGFGPIQLREAMLQWKQLYPLAKPEDFLDESIVKCINDTEEKSNAPVEELMAKLKKASPGSSRLH